MEDYVSFSLKHKKEHGEEQDHTYKIKFVDSVQFLNNSLEGLVNNLDRDKFHAMTKNFQGDQLQNAAT